MPPIRHSRKALYCGFPRGVGKTIDLTKNRLLSRTLKRQAMENQEKKSSWDDLARALGAEPAAASEHHEPLLAAVEKPPAPREKPAKTPPARP